jgi:hypothetical protein
VGTQKDKKLKIETTPGSPIPGLDNVIFPQVEVGTEMAWYRGTTFTKPVYFAFKTSQVNLQEAFQACGTWTSVLPKSSTGQYFVGVAPDADGESTGRQLALNNAREQVVKYLGEQITMGTVTVEAVGGTGASVGSMLASETNVERAASGVASFVKDEAWCVQPVTTARGNFTSVKVLTFLPNESLKAAAGAAARSTGGTGGAGSGGGAGSNGGGGGNGGGNNGGGGNGGGNRGGGR